MHTDMQELDLYFNRTYLKGYHFSIFITEMNEISLLFVRPPNVRLSC